MDPFAKALQANKKPQSGQRQSNKILSPEIEDNLLSPSQNPRFGANKPLDPFSEALARASGGGFDTSNFSQNSAIDQQKQAEEVERLTKHKQLRMELMRKNNPVDLKDVYDAAEARTQKALDDLRHELRMMIPELKELYKDIDVATFNQVTNQGREGIGLRSFYEKLRSFIQLLRKKVHSARTWLNTQSAKSNKKKYRKGGAGIEISKKGPEQTADIFDQMHHEQSTVYSGN